MIINGICISTRYKEELDHISELIKEISPKTEIFYFNDVLSDLSILEKCDFIFTIGGDGSVAWLVGMYFKTFGPDALNKLKPIVPVIRPESVGYLKQIDYEKEKFRQGMNKLLEDDFYVLDRTVLSTNIDDEEYLAVNEIYLHTAPNLGIFNVFLENNGNFRKITKTMADGLLLVTSIGSTGWGLSYNGQISLSEESLELVFVGGIHTSANFQLPRKSIKISLDLKNSPLTKTSIDAYNQARANNGMSQDLDAENTLKTVFGPRVIIDGKIVSFDTKEIQINSHHSVPFAILTRETFMDKALRLTQPQDVK